MSTKIQFSFKAQVLDFVSEEPVPLRADGLSVYDDQLENYLPRELADRGIVGGEVTLIASERKAQVNVAFWAPGPADDSLVDELLRFTDVQLQDGAGEGGFAFHHGERLLLALIDTDVEPLRSTASDQREVSAPPLAAVAARDGDLEGVKAALEAEPSRIDTPFQGYTALHYAILGGKAAVAELLIQAGADVNCLGPMGNSPLINCATAHRLDDEQAAAIAKMLIEKGARTQLRDEAGRTARLLAELRGKPRLAGLLQ